jgi:hypothetical protein
MQYTWGSAVAGAEEVEESADAVMPMIFTYCLPW